MAIFLARFMRKLAAHVKCSLILSSPSSAIRCRVMREENQIVAVSALRSPPPPWPSSRRFDQICNAIIVLYKESLSVHSQHQSNRTDIRVRCANPQTEVIISDLNNDEDDDMKAYAFILSLVIAGFDLAAGQGPDYCRISRSHTMCQYGDFR